MGLFDGLFGSKQQTTTSTSQPWGPSQDLFKLGLKDAKSLYDSGVGGKVYEGSTVIPWDKNTLAGQKSLLGIANSNMGGNGTSGQWQGIINNGGFNAGQLDALNNTRQIANSEFNINSNPAFMQVLQQSQDAARNAVNSNASAAGRYGSGANQQLLGSTIGDLTNRAVAGEYNNWQNRRDAANTNMFNMGQQGLANLNTAYTGLQQPVNTLMQVGAMNEDLATRQMNDKLRIFNEQQNNPWNQISRINAVASGAGQQGGTTTQASPGQNPFLSGLGALSGGLGLLGSFI